MPPTEHTWCSWDGAELFYRAWIPSAASGRALLLFHRGHEHSGRWQELVDTLRLEDVAIFAWDARGHGRSPGARGSAESVHQIVKDVESFSRHIRERYGIATEETIVLAHSLAAVTVGAWVHDYAPPIRAMILATAAFEVKLYVPLAVPALRLKQKLFGGGYIKSYVKAAMLTHDKKEAARYEADELIFRQIAINVLLDLHDTASRLLADAGAIHTPTLMLGAGRDWVVSLKAPRRFFDGLSSTVKRMDIFPNAYHAIFHETNREEVALRIRTFVIERFAESPAPHSFAQADRSGHTFEEYERLKTGQGGPNRFTIARAALKVAGRLSEGVKIGWRHGFDSGLSLDHIYRNKAEGSPGLGRLIDRSYLDTIGWRGIRQRRINLQNALRSVIRKTQGEHRSVRILDVAAGAGRYVIETLAGLPEISAQATLRDYRQENVDAANALVREYGLTLVTAQLGNAFDRSSFGEISPRPTIGIVSGLYELFPENKNVLESLGGLADAIEPGGYLIYTNQPWHPQIEFIARVLPNREGAPWLMRRRTTGEMDELVRVSGFDKIGMEIDRWGMFTVSWARRLA